MAHRDILENKNETVASAGPGPANGGLFAAAAKEAKCLQQTHPTFPARTSLECRNLAAKLGLNIATDDPVQYDEFYALFIDPKNREDKLDAKTVPSWKEIAKDPLTNFRIQALYAFTLMPNQEIKKATDLDPLIKTIVELLSSPRGLCLAYDDPNLTLFGNQANRAYCSYTCALSLYALRVVFRNRILSPGQQNQYQHLHHDNLSLTEDKKANRIYTDLKYNLKNNKFTLYNFNAIGKGSTEVTLEEVTTQLLANKKNAELKENEKPILLTLKGEFPDDVHVTPMEKDELKKITSFEDLEEKTRDHIIAQIATRKALQQTETFNLTEFDSLGLDKELFTEVLSKTAWGDTLTPFSKKLFDLITTNCGPLSLLQYLQVMNWLGDPSLTSAQTIPAPIAIDLFFQIKTKNVTVHKLLRALCSRAELDRLSKRDRKFSGPIVRFNDGRISFDENNEAKFFHRNLVLTDFEDKEPHKLMFMYDKGVMKETGEKSENRYQRRRVKTVSFMEERLVLDFRQILTSFNTALGRPTATGIMPDAPAFSPFKSVLALTTLGCLAFNMPKRVYPEMRVKQIGPYLKPTGFPR